MATEFYVEQADRSPQSGLVTEEVYAGELVHDDGAGVSRLTFAAADGEFGLARYDATAFAREYDDEVRTQKYDPTDDQRDRAQYQPFEDSMVARPRTIDDDAAPAPSIGHRDVIGYVDETNSDAPADAEGRVVEEGYTTDLDGNGTSTTFSRANNNFKAIGVAYRPGRRNGEAIDEYDYPVRVVFYSEPQA